LIAAARKETKKSVRSGKNLSAGIALPPLRNGLSAPDELAQGVPPIAAHAHRRDAGRLHRQTRWFLLSP
jgi:hypothetical protein